MIRANLFESLNVFIGTEYPIYVFDDDNDDNDKADRFSVIIDLISRS